MKSERSNSNHEGNSPNIPLKKRKNWFKRVLKSGDREQRKVTIRRKILTHFSIVAGAVLVMGTISLIGYKSMSNKFSYLVTHDALVVENSLELSSLVTKMESARRGFILTGNEDFLKPYTESSKAFESLMSEEMKLVSEDFGQLEELRKINALLEEWKSKIVRPEIKITRKIYASGLNAGYAGNGIISGGNELLKKLWETIGQLRLDVEYEGNSSRLNLVSQLEKSLLERELGYRKFMITGKDSYLDNYTLYTEGFRKQLEELQNGAGRRQLNQMLIAQIFRLDSEWKVGVVVPGLESRKRMNKHPETMMDLEMAVQNHEGKALLDEIHVVFETFTANELAMSKERFEFASLLAALAFWGTLVFVLIGIFLAIFVGIALANSLSNPILKLQASSEAIANGNLEAEILVTGNDELGDLAASMRTMRDNIFESNKNIENRNWILGGTNKVSEEIKGEKSREELAKGLIAKITEHIGGQMGAFYLAEGDAFKLSATYAYDKRSQNVSLIKTGEGIVGQVALEKKCIVFDDLPDDYFSVRSALGKTVPTNIIVFPVLFQNQVNGIVEIASVHEFTPLHQDFVNRIMEIIGIGLNTAKSRARLSELLEESRRTTEMLRASEEELTTQQEVLQEVQLEMEQRIETMNQSTIISETDANGNITFVNDKFCEISGYTREELIGKNHRILKSGQQPEGIFVGMWKSISTGRVWKGQILNKKKGDKGHYWVDTTIMPFKDAKGNIEKYVAIRFDITDQVEHKEQLRRQAAELEETAQQLEENNQSIQEKNEALTQARESIKMKAEALEASSKYKSEFLANMSHELRTPLNSILVLTQLLKDNAEGNLTDEQVEFSEIINKSGMDLLKLINEVLDLAKVESGKLEVDWRKVKIETIAQDLKDMFLVMSKEKNVNFEVEIDSKLPEEVETDDDRLKQIVKNLLSNAFKFTESGGKVKLDMKLIPTRERFTRDELRNSSQVLKISVSDSGIGIPKDKLSTVFEAFKQADGSTARKYGGTGLGLSISRELASLLGGEMELESEVGKGSTFTVFIPLKRTEEEPELIVEEVIEEETLESDDLNEVFGEEGAKYEGVIEDDREELTANDKTMLIVEDDLNFAKVLMDFSRKNGYKAIVVDRGDMALKHIRAYNPSAVILDMQLPEMDGWTILKKLKRSEYSNIPVHVVSGVDKEELGGELEVMSSLTKPVSKKELAEVFKQIKGHVNGDKHVLVVEDDERQSKAIQELLARNAINSSAVHSAEEAMASLENNSYECITLDLSLGDAKGVHLFEKIKASQPETPVIVFTGSELSEEEVQTIECHEDTAIVLKTENAMERVLQEVDLFLNHIDEKKLTVVGKSGSIKSIDESVLKGKRVLVVDDDIRNIYSLKAILKNQELETLTATNGKEAIRILEEDPKIDLVLMDIMMPEMDGYETIELLRAQERFHDLPIIALTAKAMKGDREKCIKAGASDYLSKPVDIEQLLSLMRVWMYAE